MPASKKIGQMIDELLALQRAERASGTARRSALTQLAGQLDRDAAGAGDAAKVRLLAAAVTDLANANR